MKRGLALTKDTVCTMVAHYLNLHINSYSLFTLVYEDGFFLCPLLHRLGVCTIHTYFTWNVKQEKNAVEIYPKDLLGADM